MSAGRVLGSTADVAGYERAAHAVFEPIAQLVARRRARMAAGTAPDAVPVPGQLQDVCVWAAGACYLLADAVLRVGTPAPNPVAPPQAAGVAVSTQAIAYLSAIEDWLVSAAEASRGVVSRLLPADPPQLAAPGAPDGFFARACVEALTALRAQLVGDVAAVRRALPAGDARLAPVDEALARMGTVADYVGNLFGADLSPATLGRIIDQAGPAITLGFRTGQVLAAPHLLDLAPSSLSAPAAMEVATAARSVTPAPAARRWGAPGAGDFDRWALSDPHARIALDSAANRAALDDFWRGPTRAALVRLQNLIEQGLAAGQLEYTVGTRGRFAAPYVRLPWAPIYTVRRPLRLGGELLAAGQTFTVGLGPDDPVDADPVILVDTFEANAQGRSEGRRRRALPRPLPGAPGFDAWVATDPRARHQLHDPARAAELAAFWQDPARASATLALLDAVEAEVAAGRAEVARREGSGSWLGSSAQVPWAPVWMASQAITVAGTRVVAGRHFTLLVSGAEARIALGPFAPVEFLGGVPPTRPAPSTRSPASSRSSSGATAAPRSIPARPSGSRVTPESRAVPPAVIAPSAVPAQLPRPHEAGFDVWSASDPHSRGLLRAQGAQAELDRLWSDAAQAERLLRVVDAVNAARGAGTLAYATGPGGRWLGRVAGAPWGPILTAMRPVTIDGVAIPAGALLAWRLGEPGIVLGPFTDTPEGAIAVDANANATATATLNEAHAVTPPPATAPRSAADPRRAADPRSAADLRAGRASVIEPFELSRDRWRLTDPHARGRLRHDASVVSALDAFWAGDDDPIATLTAYVRVEEAIQAGDLSYRVRPGSGVWEAPMDQAPYAARLEVRRDLTLLGTMLRHGRVVAFQARDGAGVPVRSLRPA